MLEQVMSWTRIKGGEFLLFRYPNNRPGSGKDLIMVLDMRFIRNSPGDGMVNGSSEAQRC